MIKILIVEDYPATSELIANVLRIEGFCPIVAADGNHGLKLAAAEMPDLILLDVMLPEINGYEVCRRLKADQKTAGIPVIFVSVRATDESIKKGKELGADDYIPKPFEPARLVRIVRAHLAEKIKQESNK